MSNDLHVALVRPAALTTALKPSTVVAPPIGVAYLAAAVRAAGFPVTVVDAVGSAPGQTTPLVAHGFSGGIAIGLSIDETVAQVPAGVGLIGVSCMFSSSWPWDRRLIDALRKAHPNATIVVGGEHASACWHWLLTEYPAIDACALGEGEQTLVTLARTLTDGAALDTVAGLALRGPDGPFRTTARHRIRDVDAIDRPAWDLVPLEAYLSRGLNHGTTRARSMPLLATRGCPYSCSFCSSPQMWTTRWRPRDPERLVDEMADAMARYDVTNFDLYDLTTIVDRRWVVRFAQALIDRKLGATYQLASGSRTEAIDDEVASLLARSGCTHITFAPESGSEEAIARHRKKIDPDRMEAALTACVRHGIVVSLNFILFPDDTTRDVLATWRFALRCARAGAADVSYFPYLPYPGSALYDELLASGRLPAPSESFFAALLDQFDLWRSRSHNPGVSDTLQQLLRFGVVGSFMAVAAARNPGRALTSIRNVALDAPRTRVEKNLSDVVRRLPAIARGRLNSR